MDLLEVLIVSSEKAANIARLLRQNEILFEKLVEQKSSAEANPRFQEDFKTLADVLIQEMVKFDVGSKFPEMKSRVYGEENNHFFSKQLKKDIIVEIKSTKEETTNLLKELLGDLEVSKLLAEEVHKTVTIQEVNTKLPPKNYEFSLERLSIWIDPIDGTNEYVEGKFESKTDEFFLKGLGCVTVLIGVYDIPGNPVMGVINQPFSADVGYQCHWGFLQNHFTITSLKNTLWTETKTVCIGGTELTAIQEALKEAGYKIVVSRGAGYKMLTVVLGIADAYILSKNTTYFWDTCAPHAILIALGGNVVEMKAATTKEMKPIKYSMEESNCNVNGIIAYRTEEVLKKLMNIDWNCTKKLL